MKILNEPVIVLEKNVVCDGPMDSPGLGHPRIYLHVQNDDRIDCPYCGKVFVYDNSQN